MTSQTDDVNKYIKSFPKDVQKKLQEIRGVIKKIAPKAVESKSYGIVGYKIDKRVFVYFAGFKNHVSMYPTSNGAFTSIKGLDAYKSGKGTLKFPLDRPLPLPTIKKFVQYRFKETKRDKGV